MKNLEIKKISGFTTAQEIPALLDREGIEFQPIDTVNWPEYPYKPEVKFRVAHTGDYILIHYTVTEASVRVNFSCNRKPENLFTIILNVTVPVLCCLIADG